VRGLAGIGRIAAVVAATAGLVAGAVAAAPAIARPVAASVVAIGDSIMDGHGVGVQESWPEVVARENGWSITDLAADGDGFVTVGDDGTTIADQVRQAIRLHPTMVILSGSSNDLGVDESTVEAATDRAVATLRAALPRAEIIAASPVWNESAFPPQLTRIATATAHAVRSAGGTVLSFADPLRGHPELMQADDVHPTVVGQRAIAALVDERLAGAGLV
jgi:acyl-CoA thioesterase I